MSVHADAGPSSGAQVQRVFMCGGRQTLGRLLALLAAEGDPSDAVRQDIERAQQVCAHVARAAASHFAQVDARAWKFLGADWHRASLSLAAEGWLSGAACGCGTDPGRAVAAAVGLPAGPGLLAGRCASDRGS